MSWSTNGTDYCSSASRTLHRSNYMSHVTIAARPPDRITSRSRLVHGRHSAIMHTRQRRPHTPRMHQCITVHGPQRCLPRYYTSAGVWGTAMGTAPVVHLLYHDFRRACRSRARSASGTACIIHLSPSSSHAFAYMLRRERARHPMNEDVRQRR
jgi:hypothetical protein